MSKKIIVILTIIICAAFLAGCSQSNQGTPELKKSTIAINLPEKYNTPDGMVLDADNNILLNIPNFNIDMYPAKVVKIDQNDQLTEICTLPNHPETGKVAPLGIDVGPDGNLYIADNQGFVGRNDNQSRIIRVNMKDGKAFSFDTFASGLTQANAVTCTEDYVYVTDTTLDPDAVPMPSGLWRFAYSEYKGESIQVAPYDAAKNTQDPHLVTTFLTEDENWWGTVGANGLAIDKKGTIYVCNFGEASVVKIKLDKNGKVKSQKTLAKGNGMKSTDGMKIHPKTGDLYIADFIGNAVHKVNPKTGKVTTIAQNKNNSGGIKGKLDKPSEVCIRGNRIYVANIDLTLDGNEFDKPHTISVIEID